MSTGKAWVLATVGPNGIQQVYHRPRPRLMCRLLTVSSPHTLQAPRDPVHGAALVREVIAPDASYGSGPRPDTFGVSTGAVRSQLDAAGIGPQVRKC